MTLDRWVIALIVVAVGIGLAVLVAWFVRRRLKRAAGGDATTAISGAAGWFVFWLILLTTAVVALATLRPDTLEDVPRQILDYTPRILAAGLILLAGYALSIALARVVGAGLQRLRARTALRTTRSVRWVVMTSAVILALAQLGVDTAILLVLVAVFGLSVGLASALLVGLGGRQMSSEIAAGRYIGRYVDVGAHIDVDGERYEIGAMHPATIEVHAGATRRHIPYTKLLEDGFGIRDQESREH